MRIIAFGDIHMNLGALAAIPAIADADLLLITGDLTNFGGRREAEQVLAAVRAVNPRILALAGNLDRPEVDDLLAGQGISLHGRGVITDGVGIFGVGGSNPTPFATPNEFAEAELATLLDQGYAQVATAARRILVCHPPPADTATDRLANGAHVGSLAVRDCIERLQPALCLTGHIHEAMAEDRIGATRIINPGMISGGGWVEVDASTDGITARLMASA